AANAAALFDESPQAKLLVQGPDAGRLMSRVCANSLDGVQDPAVSGIWLNESGRIVSLPTILSMGNGDYLVLTSATSQRRDLDWLKRQVASGEAVTFVDVTAAWTILNVVGPDTETGLARAARRPAGLELADGAAIGVGYAPTRVLPGGVADLPGWALLISADFGEHACEALLEAGVDSGLRCAGSYAARSLRLEAGRG